jgi:GT2 family glycosyltransferase
MITVCVPVLNRYDLLPNLINSINSGTVKPDNYWIIDNGRKLSKSKFNNIKVTTPINNLGTSESWNIFLKDTSGMKVIVNDDVEFYPDTLEILLKYCQPDKFVSPIFKGKFPNDYSCFFIGEDVLKKVGYFDEDISPNYAYFEDNDYNRRLHLAGIKKILAPCKFKHVESATLKSYSKQELNEHHRKFRLARANYVNKWGGMPGEEKFTVPYGNKSYHVIWEE